MKGVQKNRWMRYALYKVIWIVHRKHYESIFVRNFSYLYHYTYLSSISVF